MPDYSDISLKKPKNRLVLKQIIQNTRNINLRQPKNS